MLKNSYISQKKTFLTFLEMEPCTFQPRLEKKKKKKIKTTQIKFTILKETETSKKFIIFSQKKAVLIFQKTEVAKKLFIFQETEL